MRLWASNCCGTRQTWTDTTGTESLCVGIKGSPGRQSRNWKARSNAKPDPDGDQLYQWCGSDAAVYVGDQRETRRERIAVLTCNWGQYDKWHNPIEAYGVEYIGLTDAVSTYGTRWEQRVVDVPDGLESGKAARYYKINSRLVDTGPAEWTLYVDASMKLLTDPAVILEECRRLGDADLYLWKHHERDCVYTESEAVWRVRKESKATAERVAERYRMAGIPERCGLYLGGILVRRVGACDKFERIWWDEVAAGSVRDQIALPFALRESGIRYRVHRPWAWVRHMLRHEHLSGKPIDRDRRNAAQAGAL